MILDTCALLRLAQGEGELSEVALQRIDAAPVVYISAISSFEIGIKVQNGKLALSARPIDWFAVVLAHHNLEVLARIWRSASARQNCRRSTPIRATG